MTRLGWAILVLILLAAGAFASMTSFGTTPSPVGAPARHGVPVEDATPLMVPVAGMPRGAIRDSWGDAREGGARAHHGTDIVAPARARVVAAAPGRVEKLFQSARGGTTLYVRSDDGRWSYYYAHLAGYAVGVREGMRVRAGDLLGYVGDTGDAGAGNYHLHFGVARMRPDKQWWEGEDINPYPLLASGRLPG